MCCATSNCFSWQGWEGGESGKKKCQSNNKNSRSLYLWGEASGHQKWYTILLPPSRTKTRSTTPSPFCCLLFPCLKHSLSPFFLDIFLFPHLATYLLSLFSFFPSFSSTIPVSHLPLSPFLCLSLTFPLWPIGNCWAPWWQARVKIKRVLCSTVAMPLPNTRQAGRSRAGLFPWKSQLEISPQSLN